MTYDEARQHPLWDAFCDGSELTEIGWEDPYHGGDRAFFEQFVRGYDAAKNESVHDTTEGAEEYWRKNGIDAWWAERVKAIYREAWNATGGKTDYLKYGPGHVVWADGNFEDEHVRFCLAQCDERRQEWIEKFGESILAVNRLALEKLLAVPEDERDAYDPCNDEDDE